jgi:hypothetical protein
VRPVVVLATALAVAGCGGGGSRLSKADYETHLKRDATLAAKALTGASTANGSGTMTYARRIALAQHDMQTAADDLDGLTPPADAVEDTGRLVVGLRFLTRQLGKLHHAAATNDAAEAANVSAAVGSSRELRAVDRAVADLKRKGYDVGAFSGS